MKSLKFNKIVESPEECINSGDDGLCPGDEGYPGPDQDEEYVDANNNGKWEIPSKTKRRSLSKTSKTRP